MLTPGKGNFYVIRIEAFADPSPPDLRTEDFERSLEEEIDHIVQSASELSERELMDQIYRRLTVYLCAPCYRRWIEDPTG